MKTIFSLLVLISFSFFVRAQTFWVVSSSGSQGGEGAILKSSDGAIIFDVVHEFDDWNGSTPIGILCDGGNGKLYGVTSYGGYSEGGIVYSFDTTTHTLEKIHDFYIDIDSGYVDRYGMVRASDGMLYGVTNFGGTGDFGVIYRLDPTNDTYSPIYSFDYYQGSEPMRGLTAVSNGKLYGITHGGGANSSGVLFSFDPSSSSYADLHDFDIATGCNPAYGPLIKANNGKLYGATDNGGANTYGTIFSFDPNNGQYINIHDFNSTDGEAPLGGLIQASDGMIYGTTRYGGSNSLGLIFRYDINSAQYSVVYEFDSNNGKEPMTSLVQAANGKLYGTTRYGGTSNAGVAYSYDINAGVFTKLFEFGDSICGGAGDLLESEVDETTGVVSYSMTQTLFVFPSPSSDFITIADMPLNSHIDISDGIGLTVSNYSIDGDKLDISQLPSGFYVLTIRSGDLVREGRFFKQ